MRKKMNYSIGYSYRNIPENKDTDRSPEILSSYDPFKEWF